MSEAMQSPKTADQLRALSKNIGSVILGKEEAISLLLVSFLAGGHTLIEDVPGVGKTTLARALAKSLDGVFQRLQFTPDLLPNDILGVSIFSRERDCFEFKRGPIFANVVLADEINRATPRTQSAMLEAMNDFAVSMDGYTHPLPSPFLVVATQNSSEFEGTYPLPESQLDRFLIRMSMGYPTAEDERRILTTRQTSDPLERLAPVLSLEEATQLQAETKQVRIDPTLQDYILAIVRQTREQDAVAVGVSPRGALALMRASQGLALLEGRNYVTPLDIKRMTLPVLAHRLILKRGFGNRNAETSTLLQEILQKTPAPF